MTRTLAKRVEQLEMHIMPDAEPRKIVIQFVESGGEIVRSMDVELGRPVQQNQTQWRGGRR